MSKEVHRGWALNNEIWCSLYKELEKINSKWLTIGLNEILVDNVPNKNGVYMISGQLPKQLNGLEEFNFFTPLYVGQSTQLKDRFLAHCRGKTGSSKLSKCWNMLNLKYHFVVINENVDSRDLSILTNDIEALLIKAFGPISNERNQLVSYEK